VVRPHSTVPFPSPDKSDGHKDLRGEGKFPRFFVVLHSPVMGFMTFAQWGMLTPPLLRQFCWIADCGRKFTAEVSQVFAKFEESCRNAAEILPPLQKRLRSPGRFKRTMHTSVVYRVAAFNTFGLRRNGQPCRR
jgi:hypothetical protein